MKKMIVLVLLAAAVAGGAWYYRQGSTGPQGGFKLAPVVRGDMLITISATGTVEPEEVVDVGAQVAGKIEGFGEDPHHPGRVIDYGTEVEQGTILARIDNSIYSAEVAQAEAQVEQAKANVGRAKADLLQMQAKLTQAANNWKRAQELGSSRALAAIEYEGYEAAYRTAEATLAVGHATVQQTEKAVAQAEASLNRAKTNLGYCTIQSPVKGVIIDRRVNIGQTVVASLNAPSLFLIAKDLKRMQVWVAVNEADIGQIHPGQLVTFTVDAYPGRLFRGEVGKIRLNASMTQNVVTYTVEINTDNSDGKLLPYLTANVRFEVSRREGVLKVPNAALRWMPDPAQVAPGAAGPGDDGVGGRPTGSAPAGGAGSRSRNSIWVQDGPYVRPVQVSVGPSDGSMTEIRGEEVTEGMQVIVGEFEQSAGGGETSSPFTPKFFGGRRGG